MTKSTQEILNRIRELVPELKELKFGCEVLDRKDNLIKKIAGSNGENRVLIKGIGEIEKYKLLDICDFKIIGLPVELNHLLMVLTQNYKQFCNLVSNKEDGTGIVVDGVFVSYNLTLSVEQNLEENEALRELLSEVLW